ncbi:nucleotide exchange factor GrpE [Thalassorhabdomicrobium marinisediminis]|uniref:Protein GrpE n=1 Tax=Thalassorhabdomicrobium marinisediminis TaxID=2170577 RepID=A0A2T7FZU6_9RHOB|nr:nucleotide exchange factor GrpE [Thalassorhabdomicrobium marinisediminis]PVA07668.1 nucleotide exchange factor GrpE [Thalassorhabdomicrobium marinisediminis]
MADTDKNDQFLDDIMAETDLGPEDEMTLEQMADEDDSIVALKTEIQELKDGYMRALADAENTRKRAERDRREAENYGGSRLARDLLPVYDNLHRALQMAKEDGKDGDKALLEGVELTMRALIDVFKKHGIEPVQPEVGDKFDPQFHEAMFEAPLPGTNAGEIIQVSATGFLLHDRLLRPAQVGVSSTPKS